MFNGVEETIRYEIPLIYNILLCWLQPFEVDRTGLIFFIFQMKAITCLAQGHKTS